MDPKKRVLHRVPRWAIPQYLNMTFNKKLKVHMNSSRSHRYRLGTVIPGLNLNHGYRLGTVIPGLNLNHGYRLGTVIPGLNPNHGYRLGTVIPGLNPNHGYRLGTVIPGLNLNYGYRLGTVTPYERDKPWLFTRIRSSVRYQFCLPYCL